MDGFTFGSLLQLVKAFGLPGMVFIIWYAGERRNEKVLAAYREDTQAVAQMYKDNVELVKSYEVLSEGLHDLLVLTTRTTQQMLDAVTTNQYCPYVRLQKQAKGPQDNHQ